MSGPGGRLDFVLQQIEVAGPQTVRWARRKKYKSLWYRGRGSLAKPFSVVVQQKGINHGTLALNRDAKKICVVWIRGRHESNPSSCWATLAILTLEIFLTAGQWLLQKKLKMTLTRSFKMKLVAMRWRWCGAYLDYFSCWHWSLARLIPKGFGGLLCQCSMHEIATAFETSLQAEKLVSLLDSQNDENGHLRHNHDPTGDWPIHLEWSRRQSCCSWLGESCCRA